MIKELKENEIFVFGSNEAGIHGAGAALQAVEEFGAMWGKGFGPHGKTFAIPTKDWNIQTLSTTDIGFYVKRFIQYAINNTDKTFLITEIGCGLASLTPEDIAPMFKIVLYLKHKNIILPDRFIEVLNNRK